MSKSYKEVNGEFIEINPLVNDYWIYNELVENGSIDINTSDIDITNWELHYNAVLNLFKDGIETEQVQNGLVNILFSDNKSCSLYLVDFYINLIMWGMLVKTNTPIESKHIFFCDEIKKDSIKDYIDKYLIDISRKRFTNKELNNVIDDTLYRLHDIDNFAMYLSNTVNLEDNAFLMETCPEFKACMHADLSGILMEDVKSTGMHYANQAIDIMKNAKQYLGYDHCLADACRASEGINPKQFKEFTINIGTKPDGRGGIFPTIINKSFINGGVASPLDYFIESSTGRIAQIIKFKNVGYSGHFARLLGLNTMDSHLHADPNYDCCSHNFVRVFIKDKKTLERFNNRYYRLSPNGMEKILKKTDKDVIGKVIYLRSPITCASAANGQGVCYKCYGDLAYTVYDVGANFGVNIGRIASETLSSALTQKLLSAKHLLETFIEKIVWPRKFNELFEIEGNIIRANSEIEGKDIKIIIDPNAIELENEEDDDLSSEDSDIAIYNEYITEFEINDNGESHYIANDKNTKLYISSELNTIIRKKAYPIDGKIYIDFNEIKDITLFIVPIENNELSKTLNHLKDLLDKSSTIKGMDIHQLLQALVDTVIEGKLDIASTHLEIIVANQVRDADDILEKAKWYNQNPRYEILTLNKALTCNPSVTISMSYQKVGQLLYNPLTFKKHGSSFMDLFFMEQPQYAIQGIDPPGSVKFEPKPGEVFSPFNIIENPDKVTVAATEDIDIDE